MWLEFVFESQPLCEVDMTVVVIVTAHIEVKGHQKVQSNLSMVTQLVSDKMDSNPGFQTLGLVLFLLSHYS